jgi:hypothetical protein
VTESPREGGSEGNNDATMPPTRAEIRREIVRLVNGKSWNFFAWPFVIWILGYKLTLEGREQSF